VSGVHTCNPTFGLLAHPCPECGHKTLHQSIALEGERPIVVRLCRYCRAQWIDGIPVTGRRS
jgi:hypothetical protein